MVRRAVIAGALLLLVAPVAALAQQYPPSATQLGVDDASPAPGQPVAVAGDGYAPGTPVTITFQSTPVVVGTTRADSSGRFSVKVRVPADAEAGAHSIKSSGMGSDGRMRVLSAAVTVDGPAPAAAAAAPVRSQSRSGLSLTGLAAAVPLAVGCAALAGGGLLVMLARRGARARG
ncbi:MAG: hypothetical protein LC792_18545 [Actinobacteria bacterium]|nr:hypothetical protein [Actinomycetota bacterium]